MTTSEAKQDDDLATKIEILRDLRAERTMELQILASREQWFWVPWTTCLAGTFLALNAQNLVIRVGVPILAGLIALLITLKRKRGLKATITIIEKRHDTVLRITKSDPRLKERGFDRVSVEMFHDGTIRYNDADLNTFNFPLDIIWWTPFIWIALSALALLSAVWNP